MYSWRPACRARPCGTSSSLGRSYAEGERVELRYDDDDGRDGVHSSLIRRVEFVFVLEVIQSAQRTHQKLFQKENQRCELPEAVQFVSDRDGGVDSGVRGRNLRDIAEQNVLLHRRDHRGVRHHSGIDFRLYHLHRSLDVLRFSSLPNPTFTVRIHGISVRMSSTLSSRSSL